MSPALAPCSQCQAWTIRCACSYTAYAALCPQLATMSLLLASSSEDTISLHVVLRCCLFAARRPPCSAHLCCSTQHARLFMQSAS